MEFILDFSAPTTPRFITVFDQVVGVMYDATNSENHEALKVIERFRKHDLAFQRALDILQGSKVINTRFVVARILEAIVNEKWNILPVEHQAQIKGHTQRVLGSLMKDKAVFKSHKQLVGKLNTVIVAIAKHDWPSKWPTFIQDLVNASMQNDIVCSNTLDIIKGLSEEIFDYSKNNLSSMKVVNLKKQLHSELRAIYGLCMTKLSSCFETNGQGVKTEATPFAARVLDLFRRIIHWIPVQIVFDSRFLLALMRCFQVPALSGDAMKCLAEVAAITTLDDNVTPLPLPAKNVLLKLFPNVVNLLSRMVPAGSVCRLATEGSNDAQLFVNALSVFLTQFLTNHLTVVLPAAQQLNIAMKYLIEITKADDKDLFSICMDFWHEFTKYIYGKVKAATTATGHAVGDGEGRFAPVLHALRCVIISKMVMPEEILIETEETTGEIIQRVKQHDTELSALYETTKETLVYLTHLNLGDMQQIMNEYLQNQSGGGFTHDSLNRLCWAIGSISGTMAPPIEKRFLVTVIKELLDLTVAQKGKNNKAVIASNIMYVVGQYPEFLREHWKFLKTVVYKLFEFMKETHPGVQDMACETFLKIAKRCSREFVVQHNSGPGGMPEQIFILTLIRDLENTISALEKHQVLVFYEAVGCMVAAEKNEQRQKDLLTATMRVNNEAWANQLQRPNVAEMLGEPRTMAWIVSFLRINSAVCKSLRAGFVFQMGVIYENLLKVYQFYSQLISSRGAAAVGDDKCRKARLVKKEVLLLCEKFIEGTNRPQMLLDKILPNLMTAILMDYKQCHEAIRDSSVLSILLAALSKLKGEMSRYVAQVLSCVFDVTLPMIMTVSKETGSAFTAYPEIRQAFFKLLAATIEHCATQVFQLPAPAFKLVFDSVIQAILHFDRDIHELGLDMLHNMLTPLTANMKMCTSFFQNFLQTMATQLIHVLTDRMHVSGFLKQASLLLKILKIVESGTLTAPLFPKFPNNHEGVGTFLMHLIKQKFSERMDDRKIKSFVLAMQQVAREPSPQAKFETLLRDFVIELKQFTNQEIAKMNYIKTRMALQQQAMKLKQQKSMVPGLLKPETLFGMGAGANNHSSSSSVGGFPSSI